MFDYYAMINIFFNDTLENQQSVEGKLFKNNCSAKTEEELKKTKKLFNDYYIGKLTNTLHWD